MTLLVLKKTFPYLTRKLPYIILSGMQIGWAKFNPFTQQSSLHPLFLNFSIFLINTQVVKVK